MVKQSGGFVTVESELGKGTAFRLYFPVVGGVAENPGNSEPTENSFPRGSETVLVVEDDDQVRECSVELLSSIGYKVLAAANGVEALSLATRHQGKIDVMISDVVMPHINGAKLAATLAKSRPDMKVLFVSAHAGTVVRRKGVATDAQFLQKSYPFGLLASKLRKTLEPASRGAAAAAAGAG
jgi:two-component system cell cycle sensor histidine kinase/response regulator CckA